MARHPHTAASATLENLEPRRLLSAAITPDGILLVVGTHVADRIDVGVDNRAPGRITVTINRKVQYFESSQVHQLNIQAGQGNDFVQVLSNNFLLEPTRIYGSGGNDTLIGGNGGDRFYGGAGNDRIYGNDAGDILYGEDGDDLLKGDAGSDYLDGGAGNDSLVGGNGLDRLFGGSGTDVIDAQDHWTDHVDGGSGVDRAQFDEIDGVLTSIEGRVRR